MRRKRAYTDYLQDIIHYTEKVEQFVAGLDFKHFSENEEKTLAVTHALQIIGEAVRRLPSSHTPSEPKVPWVHIMGMRNIRVHGYYIVDSEVVWKTVKEGLPPLHQAVAEILKDIEHGEGSVSETK